VAANPTLNERAARLADHMVSTAATLRITSQTTAGGARIIDCGVKAEGGLQAGLALARVCLAGLAEVTLVPGEVATRPFPLVQVATDHPVLACMASQYAGWKIAINNYYATGSGPMRAIHAKEELFQRIPGKEQSPVAVGVLETDAAPDDKVVSYLSEQLKVPANKLTLLIASPTSIAGNVQVVARSVETALHKLHELKFDLNQVVAGFGTAPLPPVSTDVLQAIGRMNDAILYGGRVVLWVKAEDRDLTMVGPKLPSCASKDHGAPFASIFERAGGDFYKIDPMLFSPAEIVFINLKNGRSYAFGRTENATLNKSFFPPV
jgi:methenyltetrahydromethanopterin cyclohydrolase